MYKRYQRLQRCGVGRKQNIDAGKRPNHGRGLDLLKQIPPQKIIEIKANA